VTGESSTECLLVDAGIIRYGEAYQLQRELVAARKSGAIGDVLLLCEHAPVITLGRNAKAGNILASEHVLRQMKVEFCESDRGGDVTYHGPGQVVGYPILNLAAIRRDVAWYVRQLEEVMIRTAGDFGVAAVRRPGMTGIWVETARGEEKLGAIGVHLSRWVTSHGFALNVTTDLRYFDLIVPCGLAGKRATSVEKLLDRPVDVPAVAQRVARQFGEVFGMTMQAATRSELEKMLAPVPALS
jgi:lipoyl(octanoyl) transferase